MSLPELLPSHEKRRLCDRAAPSTACGPKFETIAKNFMHRRPHGHSAWPAVSFQWIAMETAGDSYNAMR
jgi:hypothetical protein